MSRDEDETMRETRQQLVERILREVIPPDVGVDIESLAERIVGDLEMKL